jgi:hypothetical protein
MEITRDILNSLKSKQGGFTRRVLIGLDVDWPPVKNWELDVIGQDLYPEEIEALRAIKDEKIDAWGNKITEAGQPCRSCSNPVIRKKRKSKSIAKKKYYFPSYLYCEKCGTIYFVDSEKVYT